MLQVGETDSISCRCHGLGTFFPLAIIQPQGKIVRPPSDTSDEWQSVARPVERVMAPGFALAGLSNKWCTVRDSGLTVTRPLFTTVIQTECSALEVEKNQEICSSYYD